MRTIALAFALAACGGSAAPPAAPTLPAAGSASATAAGSAAPATPVAPAAPAKAKFPGTPATPAGDQLAWVLDAIVTRHGKVERAEVEPHFHPSFIAQVPIDKVVEIFGQIGGQIAEVKISSVQGSQDRLVAHVIADGSKQKISLGLDDKTKQINALLFQPEADPGATPASYDEAMHLMAAISPRAQLLVAELDKGVCKPIQAMASTEELALGSSFKLYVLLALADRVIAGKAAWTDELAVRDDWKSLPSGVTQNELPGTKHPLSLFAERMISISDNTAADHLIYMLGRKTVEAALRTAKHAKPALDTPFLSTRELFVFRLGLPQADIARYLALPEAGRRSFLDKDLAAKDPNVGLGVDWKTARQIDKIEWFASADDLCHVMAALWTRAQDPKAAAVLDILGKNPGLPLDKARWSYIGYKGGSEPGVLNMTYLLRRSDGKWFVIVLGFNSAEGGTVEPDKILNIARGVIDLAGGPAAPASPAPAAPAPAPATPPAPPAH